MKNNSLRIAQVTDTHLFANPDQIHKGFVTQKSLQAVLEDLKALEPLPDLLLLTGDLSQDESADSYRNLQEALTPLERPIYWLPGNHDSLPMMEQVLQNSFILPEKNFTAGGWNFLLLNSGVVGEVHGQLSSETLVWLDTQLNQMGNHPTLIALHHPPLWVGSDWLDTITLQNSEEFFAVIDRHPQIKLVIFGHIHQEFAYQRQEVWYLGTPSTCMQFQPKSSRFSLDQTQQPGFRLLTLYPDGTWETQVKRTSYVSQANLATAG
ncbi:MAG: 3',5'-cyclic-AMP phosphodiesterase [Leptolyngbyaceae bacterium]|nr:3',5'-cyclic-AMP phosphodiesterase [Leptolyngbyaceae bacterium]